MPGQMVGFKRLLLEAQMHGTKRLVDRTHRVIWALSFALFLWAVTDIIMVTIARYMESPTYLVIKEMKAGIKFPSLVICPEVEFPEHKIQMFMDRIKIPPEVNATQVGAKIRQVAALYQFDVHYTTAELNMLQSILDFNSVSIEQAVLDMTASCEETLLRCSIFGVYKHCSELFTMMNTKSGLCCVFNGRSIRREMSKGFQLSEQPVITTNVFSPWSSLVVVVNSSQKLNNIDLSYKWAYVEKPGAFVESGGNGTPLSPNTEHWFQYKSRNFFIEDDAKSLNHKLRKCRMSTEGLKYFPIYSRRNCLVECEVDLALQHCNCVAAFHPRPHHARNCGPSDLDCLRYNLVAYDTKHCDCPSTCDLVAASYQLTTFPLVVSGQHSYDWIYQDLDLSKVSVVRASILRCQHKLSIRRTIFTTTDLFSQLGGVVSVFFGCSILSLLELVQLFWYSLKEYKAAKTGYRSSQQLILVLPPKKRNRKRF